MRNNYETRAKRFINSFFADFHMPEHRQTLYCLQYVKDYNITATNFTDASTTSVYSGTVQSGIRRHGVGVGGTSLANTLSSDTKTQTADSTSYNLPAPCFS